MNGLVEAPGAVILAAGLSSRMGQPKMLLPWGPTTVIEKVVGTLLEGGISQAVVVTGSGQDQIAAVLKKYPVRTVFNPNYEDGEMLHSLKVGIRAIENDCQEIFIVLGDQPQMEVSTIKALLEEFTISQSTLIIPSYQMRRGHPWLIGKVLWGEILALKFPETLRDFLGRHAAEIHYLNVTAPSILEDLDTPDQYQKSHP